MDSQSKINAKHGNARSDLSPTLNLNQLRLPREENRGGENEQLKSHYLPERSLLLKRFTVEQEVRNVVLGSLFRFEALCNVYLDVFKLVKASMVSDWSTEGLVTRRPQRRKNAFANILAQVRSGGYLLLEVCESDEEFL